MEIRCANSGKLFTLSEHETALRKKFGFGDGSPKISPRERFKYLGAFWPMWALQIRHTNKLAE